jgi:hypothetical protein
LRLGLFVSLLFLITFSVDAQTLKGIVVDAETAKPLYPVTVVNLTTELGYHTEQRIANPWAELRVELLPLTVQLKEYILHPDYTPFQKDSAAMATLYSTELNKKAIKPGFSTANGGGFTGLIGGPVQKISKSYRQNKKFKENFKRDIEQKYIDTKYTRGLVAALTGFGGDTLAIFMNTYIMEYPFARAASDLEIKMWIRNNYKEYLKPKTSKVLAPGSIRNK